MSEGNLLNFITVGGAAGALLLMLYWVATGKFHTHSEVEGLRQDKADLLKVNSDQAAAMKIAQETIAGYIKRSARRRDDEA